MDYHGWVGSVRRLQPSLNGKVGVEDVEKEGEEGKWKECDGEGTMKISVPS